MKTAIARALDLQGSGDLEGALAVIGEARKADPTDLELAVVHGAVLQARGDHDEAIALLEHCAISVPADKRSRLLSALGVSYDAVGREDDAIEVCRAALATEPELVAPAMILGLLLGKRQQCADALAVLRRAREHAKPKQCDSIDAAIAPLEAWIAKQGKRA